MSPIDLVPAVAIEANDGTMISDLYQLKYSVVTYPDDSDIRLPQT